VEGSKVCGELGRRKEETLSVRKMMKMGHSRVRNKHIQHTVEQVWRVSPDAVSWPQEAFKMGD